MLVIRHASAGDPEDWEGDDRLRPLDAKGFAAQSKFHTRNNVGASGKIYVGTKQGYPEKGESRDLYPGGYAMGDVNLYRYVGNQPFAGGDPSGMFRLMDLLVVIAATNTCLAPASAKSTVKPCEELFQALVLKQLGIRVQS